MPAFCPIELLIPGEEGLGETEILTNMFSPPVSAMISAHRIPSGEAVRLNNELRTFTV